MSPTAIAKQAVGSAPRCVAAVFAAAILTAGQSAAQDAATTGPFTFGAEITGFADALAEGETDGALQTGGKADLTFRLNGEAAGLWQGFFVSGHLEQNFGEDANSLGDGTILPVNTGLAFPRQGGSDTNFSLTVTQFLNPSTSITFGKFNMLDSVSATPLIGGGGTETFQNMGLAAPISGVTPPYVFGGLLTFRTEGATYSVFVYDPRNAQEDEVLTDPFSEGTTYSVSATVPVTPGGLQGRHGLRLVYSSASGIDFESIPSLALPPGSEATLTETTGYYFLSYSFQQYLVQDASGAGWGVFGQVGLSEGNPNPVGGSVILGLGGNATFLDRNADRWGIAGFYYDFSDDLEDGLAAIGSGLRDEYGLEAFYEAEITENVRLGADVQVIRPGTPGTDTAVFASVRARLVF